MIGQFFFFALTLHFVFAVGLPSAILEDSERPSNGRLKLNGAYWIRRYNMTQMASGAHGSTIYTNSLSANNLPAPFLQGTSRSFSLHIQIVIRGTDIDHFHKFPVETLYHWYNGSPLKIYYIEPMTGELKKIILSARNPVQYLPADTFFAAEILRPNPTKYTLYGCTASPGATAADMVLAKPKDIPLTGNKKSDDIIAKFI